MRISALLGAAALTLLAAQPAFAGAPTLGGVLAPILAPQTTNVAVTKGMVGPCIVYTFTPVLYKNLSTGSTYVHSTTGVSCPSGFIAGAATIVTEDGSVSAVGSFLAVDSGVASFTNLYEDKYCLLVSLPHLFTTFSNISITVGAKKYAGALQSPAQNLLCT